MPFIKISGLTTATAVSATNQLEINQNGASRSLEVSVLDSYIRTESPLPVVVSVSSSTAALRITQTGAGNSFRVEDEANPDASPFLITGIGDVGVGITVPTAKLDVRGDVLATNGTNGVRLVASEGALELKRSSSDAYIDFKTSVAEDADCRIAQLNNGLAFQVGGNGALVGGAAILSDANFQFNSGYGSVATVYGCRAWVNFNGTGTIGVNQTIRGSGNVTSVSKTAAGNYTVNFTSAMPDANYAAIASGARTDTSNSNRQWFGCYSYTTAAVSFNTGDPSVTSLSDAVICTLAIFR
jgi:hypothetical protein